MNSLQGFVFERVLSEDTTTRNITILGTLPSSEDPSKHLPAIIRVDKTALPKESAKDLVGHILGELQVIDHNDVYTWINARTRLPDSNIESDGISIPADWKLFLIHPATTQHIAKYSEQDRVFVRETPELYENVTRKYIESVPASRIDWVYNILDGKKEQESLVWDDKDPQGGFILVPDSKWDRQNTNMLYFTVILRRRDVKSLRDLTREHVPLLKHIRQTVMRVVPERYPSVKPEFINMFVHYQPTYYHFHIHVVHIRHPPTGQHPTLDDIIENLELFDGYYQRRTLQYALGVQHPLYKVLEATDPGKKFLNH
ncbi:hypothetical protein HDU93_008115 [Gonapodya sp. JEL0774]|nr:hypothetical protein HDU93_008115 [Gonapodya sp. JEL0774]